MSFFSLDLFFNSNDFRILDQNLKYPDLCQCVGCYFRYKGAYIYSVALNMIEGEWHVSEAFNEIE